AKDAQLALAEGGGEAEIRRTQALPGRKRDLALGNIFPGVTAVRSLSDPGLEPDQTILDGAIFLHHHGVGAIGHRRAGEDPDRLAATGGTVERVAGGSPSG